MQNNELMPDAARQKTQPSRNLIYLLNEPYDFILTCLIAFPGKNNIDWYEPNPPNLT